MASETTPLTAAVPPMEITSEPSYVFPRSRHRQIKQLQCCICAAFMTVFVIALIITVSYAIARDQMNQDNTTDINEPDNTTVLNINGTVAIFLLKLPLTDETEPKWDLPEITPEDTEEAIKLGKQALGDKEIFEETMPSPKLNSPSFKHQRVITSTKESRAISKRGYVEDHATRAIVKKFHEKSGTPPKSKIMRWIVGSGPPIDFHPQHNGNSTCDFNSKYRTANGTCNNRNNPYTYGVAMRPFRRSLFPDYADGVSAPRTSRSGDALPSAREISTEVHRPSYENDPHFTVMLAVWGQFLDHDITSTAGNQGEDGRPIECCDTVEPLHPECFPVYLGKGDPYYDKYNVSCMNFVRSAPAPTGKFGPREQLNQATQYIDGSVVYGSSEERIKSLRSGENGLLRMYLTPDNRTLLPLSEDPNDGCNEAEMNKKGHYCFESGDARANENLHLTSMHLIWARHHNFLATNLRELNPLWDDEDIFQEARKILGAQMQHITYNEFLPMLLGMNLSQVIGVLPDSAQTDQYDEDVDPTVANAFAASAFRFAHTLLPGLMRATRDINNPAGIALHKMLFNPYSLYGSEGLDNAVQGAINTQLARSDPYFTNELSEKLFQNPTPAPGHMCGLDLVSLNIQRGRDHGLPGYSVWREHCRLPPINTWKELSQAVDSDSFERMKQIYNSTVDIDVYTGALSETPIDGAITGPLLACLIGDQFVRLKRGDSFWYERRVGPQRFTNEQLNQIYNTTLAGVICQNSDNVTESQKYVMRTVDDTNPIVSCDTLKKFDFMAWSDTGSVVDNLVRLSSEQSNVKVMNKKLEDGKEGEEVRKILD